MAFTLGLVDYLTLKMGCDYPSDLHYIDDRKKLYQIVSDIPAEQCTCREWQDAARYLADAEMCDTSASARDAMLVWAGGGEPENKR